MFHIGAISVTGTTAAAAALQVLVQHGEDLAVQHLETPDAVDHALEFLRNERIQTCTLTIPLGDSTK